LEGLVPPGRTWVITGEAYAGLARAQLPSLPATQIVAEPSGRNTAPAIGLACVHLKRTDPQAVLAVLPADHVINNGPAFRAALARAAEAAAQGALVTLGIEPTFAHTGYGYIKRSRTIDAPHSASDPHGAAAETSVDDLPLPVFGVERFLEKPDKSTADGFLREGGYYWNGGIFVFRIDRMLDEIARQMPELARLLDAYVAADLAGDRDAAAGIWAQMPNMSIDYGIMEGAQNVAMVPLSAGWNDVGSWDALETILGSDENNNAVARHNVVAIESYNNIVFAEKQVVALIGVDDLVIVEDGDALLIGHKHQMQKVKEIVETLRRTGRSPLV
ncbi:MAG: mannose-1-phosphate guanylyltransferase, partial [Caldilineaceae bacterium]